MQATIMLSLPCKPCSCLSCNVIAFAGLSGPYGNSQPAGVAAGPYQGPAPAYPMQYTQYPASYPVGR